MKEPSENKQLFPDLLPGVDAHRPVVVAGPCSAETREQVLATAIGVKAAGANLYRAGVWKPRTFPGCFEGRGTEALTWLKEVREEVGIPVSTEVASAEHLRETLDAGVDVLWLGARTTTNPFAVQEIADAAAQWCVDNCRGIDTLRFLVKNPANQDVELWLGAIARLYNVGVRRITAIHRGFSTYGASPYRNPPHWEIPMELRRRTGGRVQLLCDPSHIGGKREFVEKIARQAVSRGYDGLIIETHTDPDNALSDARQQITPEQLRILLRSLDWHRKGDSEIHLTALRDEIDSIDDQLMTLLQQRMATARQIGVIKREYQLPVVQPSRYNDLIERYIKEAQAKGLSAEFVQRLWSLIHEESVRQQVD